MFPACTKSMILFFGQKEQYISQRRSEKCNGFQCRNKVFLTQESRKLDQCDFLAQVFGSP